MIKMYWDFYGEDAPQTAKHHEIHVTEFCQRNDLKDFKTGILDGKGISSAWVTVPEKDMLLVRDALRPKRGEKLD